MVKKLPTNARDPGLIPGEDPLEEEMATHSSILPGEFHGQRSQAGYLPWDYKELDKTGWVTENTCINLISIPSR